MSFATNEMISSGMVFQSELPTQKPLAAGQRVLKGTLGFMVGGEVYRASTFSTTPLSAAILTVAGADANGGVLVYATQANVRYTQITGGANKTLGVSVAYGASTVDVTVQLATNGGGTSTSTAADVVGAITGHAVAGRF